MILELISFNYNKFTTKFTFKFKLSRNMFYFLFTILLRALSDKQTGAKTKKTFLRYPLLGIPDVMLSHGAKCHLKNTC